MTSARPIFAKCSDSELISNQCFSLQTDPSGTKTGLNQADDFFSNLPGPDLIVANTVATFSDAFILKVADSSSCLEVEESSGNANFNFGQKAQVSESCQQRFSLDSQGQLHAFSSDHLNGCLTASYTENPPTVSFMECLQLPTQQWVFVSSGSGKFSIRDMLTEDFVLDLDSNGVLYLGDHMRRQTYWTSSDRLDFDHFFIRTLYAPDAQAFLLITDASYHYDTTVETRCLVHFGAFFSNLALSEQLPVCGSQNRFAFDIYGQLRHVWTSLCVTAASMKPKAAITMTKCLQSPTQKWVAFEDGTIRSPNGDWLFNYETEGAGTLYLQDHNRMHSFWTLSDPLTIEETLAQVGQLALSDYVL